MTVLHLKVLKKFKYLHQKQNNVKLGVVLFSPTNKSAPELPEITFFFFFLVQTVLPLTHKKK